MADRPVAPHAPQQSHALGSINRTPRTLKRGGEERTDGEKEKTEKTEEREGRDRTKEREGREKKNREEELEERKDQP